jgi:hypothetical protein
MTFDISAVMTDIGGNIGLFLGFSVLNILIGLIEGFKYCSKKVIFATKNSGQK